MAKMTKKEREAIGPYVNKAIQEIWAILQKQGHKNADIYDAIYRGKFNKIIMGRAYQLKAN